MVFRCVVFALSDAPEVFSGAASECYERIERVSEYLSRTGEAEPLVRDFPWCSEEFSVVPLLARRWGFEHFALAIDGEERGVTARIIDSMAPQWLRFNEAIEVERAEAGNYRCFDVSDIEHLPAHLFSRNHPRHDSCIPADLPARDALTCVSAKEARGVIARLGTALLRWPSDGGEEEAREAHSGEAAEHLYVQHVDPAGRRGLLCFEDSHRSGRAFLVDFQASQDFSRCDVFCYGLAPQSPLLKGSVFDVLFTAGRLVVLDVLLLNDADQRDHPNVAARMVAAHGALEALMEVWGHFVSLSTIRLMKRSEALSMPKVMFHCDALPTRYLCSRARCHPYRSGPDPHLEWI